MIALENPAEVALLRVGEMLGGERASHTDLVHNSAGLLRRVYITHVVAESRERDSCSCHNGDVPAGSYPDPP